jgi:MoaA/NifB/PqqE/SkfB family radical SAM enzyme
MCNIWKTEPVDDPSLEQLEGFFKQNLDLLRDIELIQLTGGEPFLRDDLPDIIELVKEAAPRCMIWIPTNGLLPERIHNATVEILERLDTPRLGVTVSLDGDAEVNDAQRGVEGSFKQAVTTIKNLSNLKNRGLKLSTGFTLTTENYVYAPIVQKMAYRLGSDFRFRPINFSEHYLSEHWAT